MSRRVGDAVCRLEPFFRILITVVVFLSLLFLFSLLTIEVGTEAYYISIANFVVLSTTLGVTLAAMYYCKQRDDQPGRPGE